MKKVILTAFTLILVINSGCSNEESDTIEIVETTLTQDEIGDLRFLREEEKLARDIYLYSFEKYGNAIFNNISQSEQQHMDSVLTLLNKYNIDDPVQSERGVFSNQILQGLYNDLIAQSEESLIGALTVGALIEDLDISDLELNEARTTKTDLLDVYSKLKCGSRNHLRNYISQLMLKGENYVPQYISLAEFNEIISSANEICGW